MDPNRQKWNDDFKLLRKALGSAQTLEEGKALFLILHAPLHDRAISGQEGWNLDQELWEGLTEAAFRCIPAGELHSIAWNLWHLARIEDITMNVLVAGHDQLYESEGWADRLQSPIRDTGNRISDENLLALSNRVNWVILHEYRSAVGRSTRAVLQALTAADLKRKTPPERLQKALSEGGIHPDATGLMDYWGGLTVKGLLLMPPTRHNFFHMNECLTLKRKAMKSLKKK